MEPFSHKDGIHRRGTRLDAILKKRMTEKLAAKKMKRLL